MAISDYFISRWVFFRMSWSSLGTVVFSAPRSGTKTSTRQVIACEVYFFIFYVDITRQSFVRKRPKKLKTFVPRRVSEVRLDGIVSIYIRPTISYCQTFFSVYFCCGKLLKPFPLKAGENYISSALSSYLSFFLYQLNLFCFDPQLTNHYHSCFVGNQTQLNGPIFEAVERFSSHG